MKQSNRDEFVAEAFYHFYNRSADRKTVFLNDEDFDFFLNRYQYYFNPIIDTYAFCLMKNHFHFVIRLKQEHVIRQYAETQSGSRPLEYLGNVISLDGYFQDQFKRFFSSVSIKLNNRHNRKGQVFARFPKRVFIENDDRLRFLIAYVHHNPIHHRYDKNYVSWKYSSFKAITGKKPTAISKDAVLGLFGNLEGFRNYHDQFQLSKLESKEIQDDLMMWE